MSGAIWVVAERKGADLARIGTEVATLGRGLGEASGREVVGIVAGATPGGAAAEVALYLPMVLAIDVPTEKGHIAPAAVAPVLAALIEREKPAYVLIGATRDGRDLAGMLAALLGWGLLANGSAVSWGPSGLLVEASVFGGSRIAIGAFVGECGIVTVRQGSVTPVSAAGPGTVVAVQHVTSAPALPLVSIREQVPEATAGVPIEEAEVIVAGGRGIGGPDGVALMETLARALGAAVGASRAAVDAGWIPYSQQVGQTGKVVKPQLYVALGISGAIQHKVGMQGAGTIVAIDRNPDVPIADFADVFVRGDLFEVVPAIIAELDSRLR